MKSIVDPTFSVYQLVQQSHGQPIIRHRRTMSQMSFEVEDAARDMGGKTRIFAGFQRLSKFLPQVDRYRKLAKTVESIYVFGIPDVEVPRIDNLTYIALSPADQLSKEWFVVTYGPTATSALAAEEFSAIDDPDDARVFNGVWTFNPLIVGLIGDRISSMVSAQPIRSEVSSPNRQHIQNTIISIYRTIHRIDQMDWDTLHERCILMQFELKRTIEIELEASLKQAQC